MVCEGLSRIGSPNLIRVILRQTSEEERYFATFAVNISRSSIWNDRNNWGRITFPFTTKQLASEKCSTDTFKVTLVNTLNSIALYSITPTFGTPLRF